MAKTQIELIAHYSQELTKIISSHGAESEHATYAFFCLQAAKMGLPMDKMFTWAKAETKRLHDITLENL